MDSSPNSISAIFILRATLDELFTDHRFFDRGSMTTGQIVEHILGLIQQGENDLGRLKAIAIEKFTCPPPD